MWAKNFDGSWPGIIEIEYGLQVEPFNVNAGSSLAANGICFLLSLCVKDYYDTQVST